MEVRKACAADARGIASLYLEFWAVHEGIDPLLRLKRRPTLASETEEALKDLRKRDIVILVAVEGARVLGYVEVKIVKAGRHLRMERFAVIDSLVVGRKSRRSGVGKALVSSTLSYLEGRGVRYARLNVYDSNPGAFAFWESQGFKPRARLLSREF